MSSNEPQRITGTGCFSPAAKPVVATRVILCPPPGWPRHRLPTPESRVRFVRYSSCFVIVPLVTVPSSPVVLRLLMLAAAVFLAAPLVIATRLEPSASGIGTHQQLGLPPCTAQMLWAVRCPACGMTTSWSHFVRGQFVLSMHANVAGTLLAVITCTAVVVLLSGAASGKMPRRGWLVAAAWAMVTTLVIATGDWAWRLV